MEKEKEDHQSFFQDILNISSFDLGDKDSREICEIMMKEFIRDKNLNIAEEDLYDLIINKTSILVYNEDTDDLMTINNFKEYQDKIINNGKENNNL
jgi:hypothetical protein